MKKIFLTASLIMAVVFTNFVNANASVNNSTLQVKSGDDNGGGKHIPASQVPAPVIASFNSNFPTASGTQWELEKEHGSSTYKADFYQKGKRWRAVFAPDGTLLSSGRH